MTSPAPPRLNPKKLLLSKWTAVTPVNKERYFVVTKVFEPDPPTLSIELIELEAVHSRRGAVMPWRDLTDVTKWRQGWK